MSQRVSDDPGVQLHYERLLKLSKGNHEYASRIATGSIGVPSPLYTNDHFLRGKGDGFGTDDRGRRIAKARAEAAGVSTAGKVFFPSLCPEGEPFSPKAWVSDKDEVVAKCRNNRWGLHGSGMELADPDIDDAPQPPHVDDALVEQEARNVAQIDYGGDVTPKEFVDLKETVRKRVTPTEAKRGITKIADLL